jgi:hypothetical protein
LFQRIHQFLARKQIPTQEHSLYPPNLAPRDPSFTQKLKTSLKGIHFQSNEEGWNAHIGRCIASDGNFREEDNRQIQ